VQCAARRSVGTDGPPISVVPDVVAMTVILIIIRLPFAAIAIGAWATILPLAAAIQLLIWLLAVSYIFLSVPVGAFLFVLILIKAALVDGQQAVRDFSRHWSAGFAGALNSIISAPVVVKYFSFLPTLSEWLFGDGV
jgi:hypothetical protein